MANNSSGVRWAGGAIAAVAGAVLAFPMSPARAAAPAGNTILSSIKPAGNSTAPPPAALPAAPVGPRKLHLAAKPGEVREIEIKTLGNFDFDQEKGGNIPADVKALSGMKVKMHGYMMALDKIDNFTRFLLVPSLFSCCFGQPPQVQHTIVCAVPKGASFKFFPDEVVVEGTLKVVERKEDGFILSIFEVDVTSVTEPK